jgi:oligopeptide/dipeptide ABC transporter ATP-binding protein
MTAHVRLTGLKVHYPIRQGVLRRQVGAVRAVDGVDMEIARGETFGLVGESGCGKSTLARAVLRLQDATAGRIEFAPDGALADITRLSQGAMRPLRRRMQIVFQDPFSSLNPRLRIGTTLAENLRALEGLTGRPARARVAEALRDVGLPEDAARRYPHEFSGGQRQRIAIARALVTHPGFVVLDEPVSALDVSIRAQILNLLIGMQRERGLTYLFVSHDLSVVRYICERLAVMYLGRIVEQGTVEAVFSAPVHPYTKLLLDAVPVPVPRAARGRARLKGDPPSPSAVLVGCAFRGRCPVAGERCGREAPALRAIADGRLVACHYAQG